MLSVTIRYPENPLILRILILTIYTTYKIIYGRAYGPFAY